MMINKRLIGTVSKSKKYITANVVLQWSSLAANIVLMFCVAVLLQHLFNKTAQAKDFIVTAVIALLAVSIRFACTAGAARMGYLSSKAVKSKLRGMIYEKLLQCLLIRFHQPEMSNHILFSNFLFH